MKPAKKGTHQSPGKEPKGFTDEERAAMRERARAEGGRAPRFTRAQDGRGKEVLTRRELVTGCPRIQKTAMSSAFCQSAQKFKARYATLGVSDKANLDEGHMWPIAFALKVLTAAEEANIAALVKKAVG